LNGAIGRLSSMCWKRLCRDAQKVVLVMDQLNMPSPASLYEVFPPAKAKCLADRLEIHHTPKHGSWLNLAEVEFRVLGRPPPERVPYRLTLERRFRIVDFAREIG
jgi:hypothetical protein